MSEMWSKLGESFEPSGRRAYALEKSAAYSRMAKEGKDLFEAGGGTWPAEGETLFDHIQRMRRQRRRLYTCTLVWLSRSLRLQAVR